jgi:hypothetical protein
MPRLSDQSRHTLSAACTLSSARATKPPECKGLGGAPVVSIGRRKRDIRLSILPNTRFTSCLANCSRDADPAGACPSVCTAATGHLEWPRMRVSCPHCVCRRNAVPRPRTKTLVQQCPMLGATARRRMSGKPSAASSKRTAGRCAECGASRGPTDALIAGSPDRALGYVARIGFGDSPTPI